jgi:TolB protein
MFAYVNGAVGKTDIYLYNIDTAQRTSLANDPDCDEAEPRWSPSKELILYQADCSGSYDIYTVDIASGNSNRLTRTAEYDELEPFFSPDGEWIVYRRAPHDQNRNSIGDIYALEVASGDTFPLGIRGRAPAWSPLSDKIAYMSDVTGKWQIYLFDINTTAVELVSVDCPNHCRWPAWLPHGETITYSAASDDFTPQGIWVLIFGEQPFEWLSGEVGRVSWSETELAIFNSPQGIETANFDGSNRKLVVSNSRNWAPIWNR